MKKICTVCWKFSIFKLLKISIQTLVFVIAFYSLPAPAQPIDSSKQETSIKKLFLPDPQLAALFAIVPGGGQIYNRRYWKVPIVYAVIGGLAYLTIENQKQYRRYKTAYNNELNGELHEFSNLNLPAFVLKNARDETRKSMEEAYIFLTLAYVVQIAEAYVDAHLQDFDVTDNLSIRWTPTQVQSPLGPAAGIGILIPLNKKSRLQLLSLP
ncbi:MAG: hypothetical protein KA479_02210 [Saprospiraceae bacterium]|nr:hypothetical protein [Saprospiraceae bacterium]